MQADPKITTTPRSRPLTWASNVATDLRLLGRTREAQQARSGLIVG
jgi:hypothetical protein